LGQHLGHSLDLGWGFAGPRLLHDGGATRQERGAAAGGAWGVAVAVGGVAVFGAGLWPGFNACLRALTRGGLERRTLRPTRRTSSVSVSAGSVKSVQP
jgi:hypothetical protein